MKKAARAINFIIVAALALTVGAAAFFPGFRQVLQSKMGPVIVTARNAASKMETLIGNFLQGKFSGNAGGILTASEAGVPGFQKSDGQTVKKIAPPTEDTVGQVKNVAITSTDAAAGKYTAVRSDSCYRSLKSDASKQIYQMIGKNICLISNRKSSSGYYPIQEISYSGSASEAEICLAMTAYLDDNPRAFWLANVYGYCAQYGVTKLQLYSTLSPDDCVVAEKKLDAAVASVIGLMPAGLNEFDREEYLFDYLAGHCSYDNAAVSDPGRWQAFTVYGTLIDGSAVCEGYSRAMQMLAGDVGLDCTLVSGTSGGSGHMWNEIRVGGSWYQLDLTWCDNSILIYNYYNVTDAVIAQTHQIGPLASTLSDNAIAGGSVQFNFELHSCSSTEANYFRHSGISVSADTSAFDQSVITALASLLKEGKASVAFSVQGDFDSTVRDMANKGRLSFWLSRAARVADKSLDDSAIKYITDSADRGITVSVPYR